jgi:hypothetical protein
LNHCGHGSDENRGSATFIKDAECAANIAAMRFKGCVSHARRIAWECFQFITSLFQQGEFNNGGELSVDLQQLSAGWR